MKNRRVHILGRAFRVFINEDYYFIDQAIQTLTIKECSMHLIRGTNLKLPDGCKNFYLKHIRAKT